MTWPGPLADALTIMIMACYRNFKIREYYLFLVSKSDGVMIFKGLLHKKKAL